MSLPSPDLELIYAGDPMCSWCWGFSPTLDALRRRVTLPLRTLVGGLAIGSAARVVGDDMAAYLGHHWQQVEEMTGQPFNADVLKRRGWRYDTQLPCQAVVAMRALNPEGERAFFTRLHKAFYVEGVDITAGEAYPDLVSEFDVNADAFMDALESPAVVEATWRDFAESRSLGVMGYPSLVLRQGETRRFLSRGWAPLEEVEAMLRGHLAQLGVGDVEGRFCEIGGEGC